MELRAGTSGYGYKEWKGRFYPPDLPAKGMLSFYSARFDTVEINNTFYRMPAKELLAQWALQVPPGFVFALKAPRTITHIRRLRNAGEQIRYLVDAVASLGEKLGPVLFQLPHYVPKDLAALEDSLDPVPYGSAAFEFRNPSWLDSDVLDLLNARGHAVCVSDREEAAGLPEIVGTSSWGYLRLRRPVYTDDDLARWLEAIAAQSWETAYIFFKHEDGARGPELANRFLELAGLWPST
jgi:uncharacterized protein YecE (DUF72 family)